jgi:hypothetical protein
MTSFINSTWCWLNNYLDYSDPRPIRAEDKARIRERQELGCITPEYRVDAQLAHFVDENGKIMTQYFTERFINHRNVGLASETVAEFPLHHAESGFDVGPLVIMLQEFILPKPEVVIHLRPRSPASTSMVSPIQPSWEVLIHDAEKEVATEKGKLKRLRASIRFFKRKQATGDPFPDTRALRSS